MVNYMSEYARYLRYVEYFVYLGVVAIVFAWIIIFLNWILNPWFIFTKHAYSDFGAGRACCPWLYNVGLIITGILLILFSFGLTYLAQNKIEVFGAGNIFVGGIFLALIGIFPGGTYPHVCVSTWFFIQMNIAFLIIGVGMTVRKSEFGLIILLLALLEMPFALIIELLVGWPSAAVIETYGIIFIDASVVLLTLDYKGFMSVNVDG